MRPQRNGRCTRTARRPRLTAKQRGVSALCIRPDREDVSAPSHRSRLTSATKVRKGDEYDANATDVAEAPEVFEEIEE
jgi:hypothetical protein